MRFYCFLFRLKEDLSPHYIQKTNVCIILDLGSVVYVYCGHAASEIQKTVADSVANTILTTKGPNIEKITIFKSVSFSLDDITSYFHRRYSCISTLPYRSRKMVGLQMGYWYLCCNLQGMC